MKMSGGILTSSNIDAVSTIGGLSKIEVPNFTNMLLQRRYLVKERVLSSSKQQVYAVMDQITKNRNLVIRISLDQDIDQQEYLILRKLNNAS